MYTVFKRDRITEVNHTGHIQKYLLRRITSHIFSFGTSHKKVKLKIKSFTEVRLEITINPFPLYIPAK